jgi:predicted transposase YbfD/YdcC
MARPSMVVLFEQLPDPRVERTWRHKLVDILMIVLIGTIWGCKGWDEMYEEAEAAEDELRQFLELPHGIPSADTLRRVMSALSPARFRDVFIAWSRALCESTEGKLIAIDGKTVRGAFRGESGEGALHLVNAWVCENQMVLGQYATDVKSNEITAVPELLRLLDLRGAVVSLDAMGCQKEIAKQIVEQGADYIFGLKGNQPTLHQEVLSAFDEATCSRLREEPSSFHESADKGHGRLEVRRLWVLRDTEWLTRSEKWTKLSSLVLVESERTVRGETSRERRAYISSLDASAERFQSLVRGHWQVENKLHWVLDVTFGEDRARIAKKNGAENLALVRKLALNLLRRAPEGKRPMSIVRRKRRALRSFEYLAAVLRAGPGAM